MKTVLIFSGGLDSTCLLSQLIEQGDEIRLLNFHYGSKHNNKEREAAETIADIYTKPLKKIDLDFIGETFKSDLLKSGEDIPEGHYEDPNMKKTVVPFRNGIMLSIAVGYAESLQFDRVSYGAHLGDHAIYPDCRSEFIDTFRMAAALGTYKKITIYTPFVKLKLDKGDIAKIGFDNNAPLNLTWTCYKEGNKHCGKCGACVERKEAFQKHSIKDPTIWEEENVHSN